MKFIKNTRFFTESPWPFLVSTASLFLTLGAVLFFHFFDFNKKVDTNNLITSNYIYNEDNRKKLFSFSEKIKGIAEIKEFLISLNKELQVLNVLKKDSTIQDKVVYYNMFLNDFFCYDFISFNEILYKCYINSFFSQKIIKENKFYLDSSFYIDIVYNKFKYSFMDSSLSVFDIKIFFYKNLRFSRIHTNEFDKSVFDENIISNFKLFDGKINSEKNISFFNEIFEALFNNNVIIFLDNKKKFSINDFYKSSKEEILCRSFQPIILGSSEFLENFETKFYIDCSLFEKLVTEYENSSLKTKNEIDDFCFFLILCSFTKNFSLNTSLNNNFYESITKYKSK